jgi:hypothetical protein
VGAVTTRTRTLLTTVAVVVLLSACTAGANPEVGTPGADGDVAGFWLGLWHGLIAPITFWFSLFTDTIGIYDVNNNGGWYDFGYVLALGMIVGGGGAGGSRARRRG